MVQTVICTSNVKLEWGEWGSTLSKKIKKKHLFYELLPVVSSRRWGKRWTNWTTCPDTEGPQTLSFPDQPRWSPIVDNNYMASENIKRRIKKENVRENIGKHYQRHNGPEDWVLRTKVTSLGHIASSYTDHNQISCSESRPSINFKISTKHQHFY